eukprot:CAMPEP_0180218650 /NCGR_PEP_ID=MMETSP0987-20121128/17851_1 /TAXON_ID=697907 /ORGANISM="non described non described, Strain CCMP2293" /LENGTH=215 /DNA_ID=CAMNT_0022178807 /DNA_START=197 /DNA_END=841 /DNA_ORIENTATION=+
MTPPTFIRKATSPPRQAKEHMPKGAEDPSLSASTPATRGANTLQTDEAESRAPMASPCMLIGAALERNAAGQLRKKDKATANSGTVTSTPVSVGYDARVADAVANIKIPAVSSVTSRKRKLRHIHGRRHEEESAAMNAVALFTWPRNDRSLPRERTSAPMPVCRGTLPTHATTHTTCTAVGDHGKLGEHQHRNKPRDLPSLSLQIKLRPRTALAS